MVQLKLAHDIYKRYPSEFQFHKFRFHNGTIKIFAKYFTSEHAICRFQFHNSIIKTANQEATWHNQFHFNSIMVQLKTVIKYAVEIKRNKFQFHNGTIKRGIVSRKLKDEEIFQFHNGTIKTASAKAFLCCSVLFQFHNGTIKTIAEIYLYHQTKISIP